MPDTAALMRNLQRALPLDPRPFARLGEDVGMSELEVLAQLQTWSDAGVLREISAVLEGAVLGWDSALVTGTVSDADLQHAVDVINDHPTVTHNYLRNHRYNLWFTIATPPGDRLESHLEALSAASGVGPLFPLRRTATFKIGVVFDPETLRNASAAVVIRPVVGYSPDPRARRMLRALQTPFPLVPAPFAHHAAAAGVSEAELLDFARSHFGGAIRRLAGTVRHRKMGVRANGMAVWPLAQERMATVGPRLAAEPVVSHCYARESAPGFPYTLYAMTHGPDRPQVEALVQEMSARHGLPAAQVLFSERQFKKCRLRYFEPAIDRWRATHGLREVA